MGREGVANSCPSPLITKRGGGGGHTTYRQNCRGMIASPRTDAVVPLDVK